MATQPSSEQLVEQRASTAEWNAEYMARAITRFLVHLYPDKPLLFIVQRAGVQPHVSHLARALRLYRVDMQWPEPDVLGEPRCVACNKVLREGSACEDRESALLYLVRGG